MPSTRRRLLAQLADGEFHSGEALGNTIGVSRAGIWKHIKVLTDLGLDIYRVQGRGYRLSRPLELLDANAIRDNLPATIAQRLNSLAIHDSIDSTNAELMRTPCGDDAVAVCIAEHQAAGRGRRGRQWVSPFGSNLYLSLSWPFRQLPPDFAALSLAMGVGAQRALHRLGVADVQLKWPNDIYLQGRKLGGILLEMRGEPPGACRVVAGIGINVAMPEGTAIDQAWSDLATAGYAISRNALVAGLIDEWMNVLQEFAAHGFTAFVDEWRAADILAGNAVTVIEQEGQWQGLARGVMPDGALEIERDGQLERVIVGDVSLRKANA